MKKAYPLVATTESELKSEARRTTKMLKGKIVDKIWRHRPKEIGIQFTDGTRLFVDISEGGLELSIT
ncbi:MAG: hypothetical protein U5J96_16625 [Ignavibacteriaceae bacterium]|nr:hypothetical protein [Ignavibacteriaceae bacterium]